MLLEITASFESVSSEGYGYGIMILPPGLEEES